MYIPGIYFRGEALDQTVEKQKHPVRHLTASFFIFVDKVERMKIDHTPSWRDQKKKSRSAAVLLRRSYHRGRSVYRCAKQPIARWHVVVFSSAVNWIRVW